MAIASLNRPAVRLVALAFSSFTFVASAAIVANDGFETSFDTFVAADAGEDGSALALHGESAPAVEAPYPFDDYGSKFLAIDSGDTMLWRALGSRTSNVYMDMVVQFNPCSSTPDVPANSKVAVYVDTASNIVVVAGASAGDRTRTDYVTTTKVRPEEWGRMTVNAIVSESVFVFEVRINGTLVQTAGGVSQFPSMTDSGTVTQVGFGGCGSLDDFVARTTDPYIASPGAAIGGESYATLEDALAEADADTVVALQADHAAAISGLAMNSSRRIKLNGHSFGGFTGAAGVTVVSSLGEDGVTTYSGEGAACLNGTWYSTFAAAYDASSSQSDTLVVKIGSDFTPAFTNPGGNNNKTFNRITFTTESSDELTIATTDGNSTMKAANWVFPSTATLVLNVPSNYSMTSFSGGTVEIPGGVTACIGSSTAFSAVTTLSGSGVVKVDSGYPRYFIDHASTPLLFAGAEWNGTVELSNTYNNDNLDLSRLASSHSTIRFNGFTALRFVSKTYNVNMELVGNGLTLSGDYTRTWTVTGSLSGSGALNVLQAGNGSYCYFSGDVSGFTGSVVNSATNARIVLGAGSTTASGQAIVVAANTSITNNVGTTWSSQNLVLLGALTVNGTLSVTNNCIWGNDGKGVIRFNSASTAVTANKFASSWNGTYVIGWNPTANTYFNVNDYCTNANSTVAFAGTWPNGAYLGSGSVGAYEAKAGLRLDSNLSIGNGFSGAGNEVTLSRLSGSGDFTTRLYGYQTQSIQCYYAINRLDGAYAGELVVRDAAQLSVGIVDVAELPSAGERAIKARKSKTYDSTVVAGEFAGDMKLYIGGADSGKSLVFATLSGQSGLYLAVAQVGNVKYATLADAVANAGSAKSITKLADTSEAVPDGWKLNAAGTAYVQIPPIRFTVY